MSLHHNPRIVTSGLVLALDAGDVNSYPGSGTTWYDLSGNGYNATLVNSPTVAAQGITLDGTNDYVYISHSGNLGFTSTDYTICIWHKNLDSDTGYNGIITNDAATDNAWKIFRDSGETYYQARSGATTLSFANYTVGRFHMYTTTWAGGNMQVYLDGVAGNSTTGASTPTSQSNIAFGSYRYNNATAGQFLENQVIGPTFLYNRALSATEIEQNYLAQKSRFGL